MSQQLAAILLSEGATITGQESTQKAHTSVRHQSMPDNKILRTYSIHHTHTHTLFVAAHTGQRNIMHTFSGGYGHTSGFVHQHSILQPLVWLTVTQEH